MLGLTNGARKLEGTAGGHTDETSSAQAIAWFRRPTSCTPTRTAAQRAAAALHHRAGDAAGAVD
jgi:hypothetical protein